MSQITPLAIGVSATGDPIALEHDHLTAGMAIVGVSGAGKTYLLRRRAKHWLHTPGTPPPSSTPSATWPPAWTTPPATSTTVSRPTSPVSTCWTRPPGATTPP